ncbi:MAG: UDP-N-acetylmuramate dehydrogenase [Candidatus Pacebacteria bacterium]|nr:UDP-N-acetylmuramate dehydrogenase [Candidatus Paceibacterota bacterium]
MEIKTVSLKDYSSLRIGGEGKLVVVRNEEELHEAVMHAEAAGLRVHLIGQGTNSYFGDDLSEFLFVQLDMKGIFFDGETVTAYASVVWDDLVIACVSRGLWGIENLSYIPGTVGAAPVQNIGAYGTDLSRTFVSLRAYDTELSIFVELNKDDCMFGYRDSLFKKQPHRYVIISVCLKLSHEPRPVLVYKPLDALVGTENITLDVIRELVVQTRTQKLPDWKVHPNAGSFFKNTTVGKDTAHALQEKYPTLPLIEVVDGYKVPSAWLIEHVAGMKGVRVGDIGTWPLQPLVLVNYGDVTADDVDAFAKSIKEKIYEKTSLAIEQEVNRVG